MTIYHPPLKLNGPFFCSFVNSLLAYEINWCIAALIHHMLQHFSFFFGTVPSFDNGLIAKTAFNCDRFTKQSQLKCTSETVIDRLKGSGNFLPGKFYTDWKGFAHLLIALILLVFSNNSINTTYSFSPHCNGACHVSKHCHN